MLTLDISTFVKKSHKSSKSHPRRHIHTKDIAYCLILLTLGWYYLSLLLRNLYDLHLAGIFKHMCKYLSPFFFYKEILKLLVPSLFPNIQASECFLKAGPCCVA